MSGFNQPPDTITKLEGELRTLGEMNKLLRATIAGLAARVQSNEGRLDALEKIKPQHCQAPPSP